MQDPSSLPCVSPQVSCLVLNAFRISKKKTHPRSMLLSRKNTMFELLSPRQGLELAPKRVPQGQPRINKEAMPH
jgi:hypothetical protein